MLSLALVLGTAVGCHSGSDDDDQFKRAQPTAGAGGSPQSSGGQHTVTAMHGGSSGGGGTNTTGSGGKTGAGSVGECIAEGADCRQTTKPCCEGLLCSQTELTCLVKCTQAGECIAAFNEGRAGAKGMCCKTRGYDPANSSNTGLVCGASCPP